MLRPWINGLDIVRRPRDMWLIDFNAMGSDNEAAFYEGPFAYILAHVKPERVKNRREAYARNWWKHVEARPRPHIGPQLPNALYRHGTSSQASAVRLV